MKVNTKMKEMKKDIVGPEEDSIIVISHVNKKLYLNNLYLNM